MDDQFDPSEACFWSLLELTWGCLYSKASLTPWLKCDLSGCSVMTLHSGWLELKYLPDLCELWELLILKLSSHFLLGLIELNPLRTQSISNRLKRKPGRFWSSFSTQLPPVQCSVPTNSSFLRLPNSSLFPLLTRLLCCASIPFPRVQAQNVPCDGSRGDCRACCICFPSLHRVTILCFLFPSILKLRFLCLVQFSGCLLQQIKYGPSYSIMAHMEIMNFVDDSKFMLLF